MKSKILGLLAAGMLAATMTASAANVTWDFEGTIIQNNFFVASGQDIPVVPGNEFSLRLAFDPTSVGVNTSTFSCDSTRCQYNIPELSITNLLFNGVDLGQPGSLLTPWFRVYSGFGAVSGFCPGVPTGNGVTCDNYFIRGFSQNEDASGAVVSYESWSFFLGSNTLDFISGAASGLTTMPSLLPPLSQLQGRGFQFCRGTSNNQCDLAFVNGVFSSGNAVPEPGTLALLGLGLAGLGLSRRRKA